MKPRKSFLKRSAIKRKHRKPSEFKRIYGPKGYVEWIHEQPCIACGVVGFSECAHIKTGGMGRKDDWTDTVPLCGLKPIGVGYSVSGCHEAFHNWGRKTFELVHDLDLTVAATATQNAYKEFKGEIP